ncbi:MAG: hypothetical protein LCH39_14325 [Proteobacteria bacterium]|nr:hypothetical protein [Pseudomonadota bacterium]
MLMSAAFMLSALLQFALSLVVAAILGPGEFGLYALVLSGGVLLQTFAFEWLRLCAARFHHKEAGEALARSLWRKTGYIGFAALATSSLLAAAGIPYGRYYALVPILALINAISDMVLALLRAEFETRRFALTLSLRALLSIVLVPLAAWYSAAALPALAALGLATLLPALVALARRHPPQPTSHPAPSTAELLRYAGPIVATNGLYLGFFFALRAGVAAFGGLAAVGQFSLALEFVLKLFSTIGTALDLALFPLALKAEREHGLEAAETRARANLEIGIAVLAPMAMGLMLIAPGLEPLLVAPAYQGPFAAFVLALTPGIALYALVQYGLHPFGQLRHQTGQLLRAALLACITGLGLGVAVLAASIAPAKVGLVLAIAMLAATLSLGLSAGRIALPSARFAASLVCCLALLGVAVTPFVALGLSLPSLIGAVVSGALAYAGGAFALDLAGLKTLLKRG